MAEPQNCYVIQWEIENFSMCCVLPSGHRMQSPHFREESSQNQVWYLNLFPVGNIYTSYTALELCNTIPVRGIVNCTVSVIDTCGFRHFERSKTYVCHGRCSVFLEDHFIEHEKLFDKKTMLLPNNTLTVQCVIRKPYRLHSVHQSLKLECHDFTWRIELFSLIRPGDGNTVNDEIPSYGRRLIYPLTLGFENAPLLHMQFGVKKNTGSVSKVFVKFYRARKDDDRCSVYLSYRISAVSVTGSEIELFQGRHAYFYYLHMSPCVLLEDRDSLIVNNTLTLHVELRFTDGSILPEQKFTVSESPSVPPPKAVPSAFQRNLLEKLLADDKFSDVVFKVGTESLSAHRAVLCAQSEVFAAMFDSGLAESVTGEVRILDIDVDTMRRLLRLFYAGAVDEQHMTCEDVLKLYSAAHKYQVPFMDTVTSVLVSKIAVDNVWKVWSHSARYEDAALKAAVKAFISLDAVSVDDIAAPLSSPSKDATKEEIGSLQRHTPKEQNVSKKFKRNDPCE